MDLSKIKSIHFVGIKGVAMASLAIVAKEMGIKVTGSDIEEEFPTDQTLKRFDISVSTGFAAHHLPNVDLVIYTGAHNGCQNAQVQEAKKRGIAVLPHGQALGLFMKGKRQISVAGSHGKTTTSAMIAFCLMTMDEDPSFAIGCGEITNLKTSGHFGKSPWFVAEADEYATDPQTDLTPRFMWHKPQALVITNIDFDHPDIFQDLEKVVDAFWKFSQKLTANGFMVINKDDEQSRKLLARLAQKKVLTYGAKASCDFQIHDVKFANQETLFELTYKNQNLGKFNLRVSGLHNVYNATAVIATLYKLQFPIDKIRIALSKFSGTKRRFELIIKKNGKYLFDDYAHHPAEIEATIKAFRNWFPDIRLVVIFQPHTYSRTQALLSQFAKSLSLADEILVTEIYASAREQKLEGFSGEILAQKVKGYNSKVIFTPHITRVLQYIQTQTRSNDLIVTMGAGDIFSWLSQIQKYL